MVEFMDNKINIAGGMIMRLRGMSFYYETNQAILYSFHIDFFFFSIYLLGAYDLSLEAQVFYHYGYTSTELDVVILAWKEKVRHDLIRPTTLVQALGDRQVQSFAGTHLARDWVPYIRVMPHAEYPSGSGCICLGIAQFIDAFLQSQYRDDSIMTEWMFDSLDDPVVFNSMMDLANVCGESRLWGGMHFTAAVPDSYELCDEVGTLGYTNLMVPLLGGSDYHDLLDGTERYCSDMADDEEVVFCDYDD